MPKSFLKSFACLGCVGAFSLAVASVCVVAVLGYFGVNHLKAQAEHFNENRAVILSELESDLAAGRFDEVIDAGNAYVFVDDAELDRLVSEAKRAQENLAAANHVREIKVSEAMASDDTVRSERQQFDVLETCFLRDGPSEKNSKIVNEKATRMLGETQYQQIDSSTTIELLDRKNGWVEVRVIQPEHLRATHPGWVPAAVLAAGPATDKKSGYIRNRCDVFEGPNISSAIVGHLKSPSSVEVADDGSGWLRLIYAPIRDSSNGDFLDRPDFDGGMYIESRFFTTELPANWR